MHTSSTKIVLTVLMILTLIFIGIGGVYGGYFIMNTGGDSLPGTWLPDWLPLQAYLSGLAVFLSLGLISIAAATWLIVRFSYLFWRTRRDSPRSISI